MKALVAGLVVGALSFSATTVPCDDHLVSRHLVDVRLTEARQERTANAAAVQSLLSEPAVRRAASLTRLGPDTITARLSSLSDQELRDLADRAAWLHSDPQAGMSRGLKVPLIILGAITAFVVILWVYVATCNCYLY
jgi:hypothetical protein